MIKPFIFYIANFSKPFLLSLNCSLYIRIFSKDFPLKTSIFTKESLWFGALFSPNSSKASICK